MRTDPENEGLSLSELMSAYLNAQAARFGETGERPGSGSEVELHEAATTQAPDPRLAWEEATTALRLGSTSARTALPAWSAVPDWKALVAAQEPALDLALCAGNFPQMVRNLNLLLQGTVPEPRPAMRDLSNPALTAWAEEQSRRPWPCPLLAVGVLRLARDADGAAVLLKRTGSAPAEWRAAWQNEEAALAWDAGRRALALALWQSLPADFAPALFNRGMALLFSGKAPEARGPLTQAVAKLPEDNSWHHLGRLYLTLAEMRS